jgi:hypothetical protein
MSKDQNLVSTMSAGFCHNEKVLLLKDTKVTIQLIDKADRTM